MTDWHVMVCGCKASQAKGVEFCPMHRAAPDLLAALEAAKISTEDTHKSACEQADWHNNNTPEVGQTVAYAQRPPEPAWLPEARAAIAKAKAKAKED